MVIQVLKMSTSRNQFILVMGVVAATPMCYYLYLTLKNTISTFKRLIQTLRSNSTTQFITLDNDKVGLLSYSLMGQKYNLIVVDFHVADSRCVPIHVLLHRTTKGSSVCIGRRRGRGSTSITTISAVALVVTTLN